MPELAIFLFKHFGLAAVVVIFGVVADYVSSQSLKADVVAWMSAQKKTRFSRPVLSRVLTSFLTGFVQRVFAPKLWSFRFLLRSSIVSASIFILIIFAQGLLYAGSLAEEFAFFSVNPLAAAGMLGTALILNWLIDYAANVKTYSLLRMASESGRPLDFLLTIFADLTLTVALFVTIFPATVVASLFIFQFFNRSTTYELRVADPVTNVTLAAASQEFIGELTKLNGTKPILHSFFVTNLSLGRHLAFANADTLNYALVFTFDTATDNQALSRYTDLLDKVAKSAKLTKPLNTTGGEPATIEIEREFDRDLNDVISLYDTAAAQINENRRFIIQMLTLRIALIDFATAEMETDDWETHTGLHPVPKTPS